MDPFPCCYLLGFSTAMATEGVNTPIWPIKRFSACARLFASAPKRGHLYSTFIVPFWGTVIVL